MAYDRTESLRDHIRSKIEGSAILAGFAFILFSRLVELPWGYIWDVISYQLQLRALTYIILALIGFFFALESYNHASNPDHSISRRQIRKFYTVGDSFYLFGWLTLFMTIIMVMIRIHIIGSILLGVVIIVILIFHKVYDHKIYSAHEDVNILIYVITFLGLIFCFLATPVFINLRGNKNITEIIIRDYIFSILHEELPWPDIGIWEILCINQIELANLEGCLIIIQAISLGIVIACIIAISWIKYNNITNY